METSFDHLARDTAKECPVGVSRWLVDHVNHRRRYCLPNGQKLRKELLHERKALVGRYYQLLLWNSTTGDHLYI